MSDLNITLFHPPSSRTDAISVPPSTTLSDLSNFASALLGIEDADGSGVVLARGQSRTPLLPAGADAAAAGRRTLAECGVGDGELVSAYGPAEWTGASEGPPARQRQRTGGRPTGAGGAGSGANAASGGGAGGLDFSSLLGGGAGGGRPQRQPAGPSGGSGGLDFSSLLASAPLAAQLRQQTSSAGSAAPPPSYGTIDDAVNANPNPTDLMRVLVGQPNLMKQLNYHDPITGRKLADCGGDVGRMAEVWRTEQMRGATKSYLRRHGEASRDVEMRRRLEADPMDAEANKHFGEKIRLANVQAQYERMMEEYPESMGRVLMLYIAVEINGKPLQVFVDSGAQSTIMSSECADRLGLLHLVDERFAGVAVGVGTGKIMGRIHCVEFGIGGALLPCTLTVMDSESGLGDKNMDVLLGLDMLKRHRCRIDLGMANALVIPVGGGAGGETIEAPFLHEKDLDTAKGGTRGFDAERENAELMAAREKAEEEEDGDGDEAMDDVDGDKKPAAAGGEEEKKDGEGGSS